MKWFKHDSDAHRDAKLKKLVMNYGMEAYGLYWHCLEEIANGVSQEKHTFELEHDAEVIAFDTGMTLKKVEEIMKYMVSIGLFENDNGLITCLKMAKRLDSSMTSNQQMRNIISSIKKNHDSVMTPSIADKKRREEKRINKKTFPPTLEEVTQYCLERKNNINPQKFIDHYTANGWMRGKTKIKDWKACVRTWEGDRPKQPNYADGAI